MKVHAIIIILASGFRTTARFPYQSLELHMDDLEPAIEQYKHYIEATKPNDRIVSVSHEPALRFDYRFDHEMFPTGIQDMPWAVDSWVK